MQFLSKLKPALLLVMALAFVPMFTPAASAEPVTIYAEMGACRENVDGYRIQLQSGDQSAPASDFPKTVTLTFADGSTLVATGSLLGPRLGTATYSVDGATGVYLESATAVVDTEAYPEYRFTVTARPEPCFQEAPVTNAVSGTVLQRGNEKPVADLEVCLVEANLCTTTDASGAFVIEGVEDGTYTLTTNGINWKPQSTTVTVAGGDVVVNVVQQKGGGN